MSDTVVLIDPDEASRRATGDALEKAGCQVRREAAAGAGLDACARLRPDVVVVDLAVPDLGPELLARLRAGDAAVVPLAEPRDGERAARLVHEGMEPWVPKPVDPTLLAAAVVGAAERARTARYVAWLRSRDGAPGPDLDALGSSPAMRHLGHQIGLLAANELQPVLITGEPGTGKGWVARLVHALSPRGRRPFIQAPATGPSAALVEGELFGLDGPRRHGLVDLAEHGTLFLHEVGLLPPALQPQLLQLLDRRTMRRAGGARDVAVDVRVVAATSHDLVADTSAGGLREDLYYRLSVAALRLPPLRERAPEDRAALVARLVADLAPRIAGGPAALTPEAADRLVSHPWPGNVRELKNALERTLLTARGAPLAGIEHLPGELRPRGPGGERRSFQPAPLEDMERAHIERALRHFRGNRTRTAQALGISRATLINKIKRYALEA